jgi:hypothetical protein
MERTKKRAEEPCQPDVPVDYFIVGTSYAEWYVSKEMAAFVAASLEHDPPARWVTLVDLTGATIRVRGRIVLYVQQCTVEQRALARAMQRAINKEAKADRDWDEE